MENLNFKQWIAEDMATNANRPPEETDPTLGPAAKAAQIDVQNAVKMGKDPIKAAQMNLAKNKNIAMNKLGKIMPVAQGAQQKPGM